MSKKESSMKLNYNSIKNKDKIDKRPKYNTKGINKF